MNGMSRLLLWLMVLVIVLVSCGKKVPVVVIDEREQLAQAFAKDDQATIEQLRQKLLLTENSQNIIKLYQDMQNVTAAALNQQADYLAQFYGQMDSIHKSFADQLRQWVYVKQIYQIEIAPPVRILQREQLYLAPSNINFSRCSNSIKPSSNTSKKPCATELRSTVASLINEQDLEQMLQEMARKDPCANLSSLLKGEEIAHRCLKKSEGKLSIQLLPVPRFSEQQWLKLLTHKNNHE